jgi:hypothetical protein
MLAQCFWLSSIIDSTGGNRGIAAYLHDAGRYFDGRVYERCNAMVITERVNRRLREDPSLSDLSLSAARNDT